jgi:hypothetical protein
MDLVQGEGLFVMTCVVMTDPDLAHKIGWRWRASPMKAFGKI